MPTSISIVISDGVADVNHIPVISTIDDGCENFSLGSAASYASLTILVIMVALIVNLKKVKMLSSFFLFYYA